MKKLLLISSIIFGSVSIAAAQAADVDPAAAKAKAATPVKPVSNKAKDVKNADAVLKQKEITQASSTTSIGARPASAVQTAKPAATTAQKRAVVAAAATTAPVSPAKKTSKASN